MIRPLLQVGRPHFEGGANFFQQQFFYGHPTK